MIAVLVALQFATKAMGQFVTGSCVNMVLVVATLCGGFWCGFATALVCLIMKCSIRTWPGIQSSDQTFNRYCIFIPVNLT